MKYSHVYDDGKVQGDLANWLEIPGYKWHYANDNVKMENMSNLRFTELLLILFIFVNNISVKMATSLEYMFTPSLNTTPINTL